MDELYNLYTDEQTSVTGLELLDNHVSTVPVLCLSDMYVRR